MQGGGAELACTFRITPKWLRVMVKMFWIFIKLAQHYVFPLSDRLIIITLGIISEINALLLEHL